MVTLGFSVENADEKTWAPLVKTAYRLDLEPKFFDTSSSFSAFVRRLTTSKLNYKHLNVSSLHN